MQLKLYLEKKKTISSIIKLVSKKYLLHTRGEVKKKLIFDVSIYIEYEKPKRLFKLLWTDEVLKQW